MFLVLALILVYLVQRSFGLNPAVFADEWYYSKFSRLAPLNESILPSYLYLWIMGATSSCGTGFLDCARIMNAVAFVCAAPFIYFTARVFTTVKLAAWVAVVCTLLPAGSFTAFFMPEASYYLGFSILAWYALTRPDADRRVHAVITGVILGALSLVKVHALFLLPGLCIYLVYISASDKTLPRPLIRGVSMAVIAVLAVLVTKFGLGYLLVGKEGLSLFGSFYSATADISRPAPVTDLLAAAFINGRGHAMALALLFAVPLAIVGHTLCTAAVNHNPDPRSNRLHVFAFLMLGSVVAITVAYTASIGRLGLEELLRLHMRYYDFTFPLLLMVAANAMSEARANLMPKLAWFVTAGFGILVVLATVKLPLYVLRLIDAPELISIVQNRALLYGVAALSLLGLVLWAMNKKAAPAVFLFVLMPVTLIVAEFRLGEQMQPLVGETEFDIAGKYVRDKVPAEERKDLVVIGSGVGQMMRVLFFVDNKGADFIDVPYGSPLTREQLPLGKKWVLVVHPHPLPDGLKIAAQTKEFTLVELGPDFSHDTRTAMLNGPLPAGPIVRADGLSEPEPMGRWSNAKQVVLHLAEPLPEKLSLGLHAAAFGPNINQPFLVTVGTAVKEMRLGPAATNVSLDFDTDGKATTIVIEVPQPTSPLSLKQSNDPRPLGIMLGSVTLKASP